MILTDVHVTDFLSIRTVHLRLPTTGLILLTGWDEDLGRANGAGKTSIFQAICWCLYEELTRDISVHEIVRRSAVQAIVTVKFTVDGDQYECTRKRGQTSRDSGFEVKINGKTEKGTGKYLTSLVALTIGLTFDQFLVTSYFPQKGDASRFIRQRDVDAKSFLGNLMGFSKVDDAHAKLKSELRELQANHGVKLAEVTRMQESIERFLSLSSEAPVKPDVAVAATLKQELSEVRSLLAKPPNTDAMDQQIATLRAGQSKVYQVKANNNVLKGQIQTYEKTIAQLKSNDHRHHVMECPYCKTELIESSGKLREYDESSADDATNEMIEKRTQEIASRTVEIADNDRLLARTVGLDEKLDKLRQDRSVAWKDYEVAKEREKAILARVATFQEQVKSYQREVARQQEVTVQVAVLQEQLKSKIAEVTTLEDNILVVMASKDVTSPNGVVAYSLDSVIHDVNEATSSYLDVFSHGTMTYALSLSDDKGKISHSISKGGTDVSVGSLSGGEDRGLVLSVDLGLSDVIAARRGTALPSLLLLDECFEGLDYVGKEKVIDALREVARDRCVIVIDHSTEFNALFDSHLKIVKKNDISELAS